MSETQARPCPACGSPFTWSTASPRQRFCSPRCKAARWRATRRAQPTARTHNATRHDTGDRTSNNTRHHTRNDAPDGDVTAVHAYPHCRQHIAVITWLVTPAAARVPAPSQHAVTVHDRSSSNT